MSDVVLQEDKKEESSERHHVSSSTFSLEKRELPPRRHQNLMPTAIKKNKSFSSTEVRSSE